MGVIVFLASVILVGAFAGWLTGKIMGFHAKFWANAALGIFGYLIGSFLGALIGFRNTDGILVNFAFSVAGACLITFLIRKFNDGKAGK
ncbi:GlsB/YeaQ/YmgE family stress response membrane protein [Candidatus Saccharibacteria bacterium]|nr:MAG: GlsB/YeaQ/YmgE family stress response membrane protein [Candidatus Saccharibacteria bacterium]